MYAILEGLVIMMTEIFWPETEIDVVRNFNSQVYNEDISQYGDHTLKVDTTTKSTDDCIIIDNTFNTEQHRLKNINHKRRFQTVKPQDSLTRKIHILN
jgi:hypothetical protein